MMVDILCFTTTSVAVYLWISSDSMSRPININVCLINVYLLRLRSRIINFLTFYWSIIKDFHTQHFLSNTYYFFGYIVTFGYKPWSGELEVSKKSWQLRGTRHTVITDIFFGWNVLLVLHLKRSNSIAKNLWDKRRVRCICIAQHQYKK